LSQVYAYCILCVHIQEALKLTADLRKRKQDLLDKQLAQQKLLIERLEKGGVGPEQREALMTTIKKLQVGFML
jgi:RNA-binding protein 26